jgi:hypothetical protein
MNTLEAEGVTYTPTLEDRLWLLRAVSAEGPPKDIVAQTLINGFMWARSRKRYSLTLSSWVRAYAQPVNPRWFVDGDLFRKKLLSLSDPHDIECETRRAELRRKHSAKVRFDRQTTDAVDFALSSRPKLPTATDYAAHYVAKDPAWQSCSDATVGQNRFWTRPAAIGWAGYSLIKFAAKPSGNGTPGTGGIVAILLFALVIASVKT